MCIGSARNRFLLDKLAHEISQWCGHCKVLQPEFTRASEMVGRVSFGAVDATACPALKSRFNVQSYPTILWGRAGALKPYSGGRKAKDLAAFATLVAQPTIVSVEQLDSATSKDFPVAFVFQGQRSGALFDAFSAVAAAKQGAFPFGIASPDTAERGVILPAVFRVESGQGVQAYGGQPSHSDLTHWVHDNRFPTVTQLGPGVFHDIANKGGRLLAIGVMDERFSASAHALQALHELAQPSGPLAAASAEAFHKFRFATLNGSQWVDYIAKYNISPADMPKLLVLDAPAGVYYLDQAVDEQDEMLTWLLEVADGRAPKNREGILHFPTAFYNAYVLPHLPWSAVALAAAALLLLGAAYWLCGRAAGSRKTKSE